MKYAEFRDGMVELYENEQLVNVVTFEEWGAKYCADYPQKWVAELSEELEHEIKIMFVKHGISIISKDWAIEFGDCVDGLHYTMFIRCDDSIKNHYMCITRYGWLPLPPLIKDDLWEEKLEVD